MNETARKWLAGELVGGAKLCSSRAYSSSKETIFNLDSSVRYGVFFYFKILCSWFKSYDIHKICGNIVDKHFFKK